MLFLLKRSVEPTDGSCQLGTIAKRYLERESMLAVGSWPGSLLSDPTTLYDLNEVQVLSRRRKLRNAVEVSLIRIIGPLQKKGVSEIGVSS